MSTLVVMHVIHNVPGSPSSGVGGLDSCPTGRLRRRTAVILSPCEVQVEVCSTLLIIMSIKQHLPYFFDQTSRLLFFHVLVWLLFKGDVYFLKPVDINDSWIRYV